VAAIAVLGLVATAWLVRRPRPEVIDETPASDRPPG